MSRTARARYQDSLEAVGLLAAGEVDPATVLEGAVDLLAERFDHYTWLGIYLMRKDEQLVLGPWRGPEATEHVRIAVGEGICGAAAASGRTEIVDDVQADDRYLACFPSTRSEIVVPISYERRVVGEIDIDSDAPAAFDEDDRLFLETVAERLAPHVAQVASQAVSEADDR
jgi:L-methionine (R)-S-oxide reductase